MSICSDDPVSGRGISRGQPRSGLRCVTLLAASVGAWAISTVALVPSVSAAEITMHVSNSTASAFCAKMPASKVSSIVGSSVALTDAMVQGSTLVCLYEGSSGAITLEKETGMAASGIATRQKAEAGHKKLFYAS